MITWRVFLLPLSPMKQKIFLMACAIILLPACSNPMEKSPLGQIDDWLMLCLDEHAPGYDKLDPSPEKLESMIQEGEGIILKRAQPRDCSDRKHQYLQTTGASDKGENNPNFKYTYGCELPCNKDDFWAITSTGSTGYIGKYNTFVLKLKKDRPTTPLSVSTTQ